MTFDLKKTVSLAAMVAVAGVMILGAEARAADLGGNCCADLEERIAELEATTVLKGNRKVSLTVSGQVNEAVMFWDDGVERNAYVSTNEAARSRFRFAGSAKIDANSTAGYLLEIGVRGNRQNNLSQDVSNAKKDGGLDVRHSAWWLQNKDLGKVVVGMTSEATDGITEINLSNTGHFGGNQIWDSIGGFSLRGKNGAKSSATIVSLGLDNTPGEGSRINVVKYETPSIFGFVASASWGEDDMKDVALRYGGELSGFKLAGGIGYIEMNDATSNSRGCARLAGKGIDCNELGMSGTIMHIDTGLYVHGSYGYREDNLRSQMVGLAGTKNGTKPKDELYLVQAGVERAFLPLGKSTVYGEYLEGNFGAAISGGKESSGKFASTTTLGLTGFTGIVGSTDITMWGVGFNQNIAAAAMDVYVSYRSYEFDVKDVAGDKAALNDMQVLSTGARIQF